MDRYKSFEYLQYILNLPFYEGMSLYIECIEANKKDEEEKIKAQIWELWLVEIQNGYKDNFDTYYKNQTTNSEVLNMSFKEKEDEESRIVNKFKDIDKTKKFKKKVIAI